jgi:hypothetical protein
MSGIYTVKDLFEILSYLTITLGLPVAILQFKHNAAKEQADREYGTYNALDEKYIDFVELCFENPNLNIFDIQDAASPELTATEKKQELIAFTMLFSIFERAYLMYRGQVSSVRIKQWTGWYEYIQEFSRRPNFIEAWSVSGHTFDADYQEFMEALFRDKP